MPPPSTTTTTGSRSLYDVRLFECDLLSWKRISEGGVDGYREFSGHDGGLEENDKSYDCELRRAAAR